MRAHTPLAREVAVQLGFFRAPRKPAVSPRFAAAAHLTAQGRSSTSKIGEPPARLSQRLLEFAENLAICQYW
jgi:hypothetical protein